MSISPHAVHAPLRPYAGRGLFVTGTGSDVGKTMVAAAMAGAFHRMHLRVGVCKPIASGCPKFSHRGKDPKVPLQNDDYQSPDAAATARAAGLDPSDELLLRHLSPLRYAAPVSPHIAARMEEREPDWRRVESSLDWWQENCDVLIVEGAGGWYVPLDRHDFMIGDLATALRLPVIVVTPASLGAINMTLLTVHAIRERNLPIAGLVLNRVPAFSKRDLAIASNLEELPRLAGVPVRAVLPDLGGTLMATEVPEEFIEALMPFAQEWWGKGRENSDGTF